MRVRGRLIVTFTTLVVALIRPTSGELQAQAAGSVALSGVVSSQQEGKMEGVVVSARRDGVNVTVSVVSDAQGRYSFPRTHLQPGKYTLTIRAVGYDLTSRGPVDVADAKASTADLALQKTRDLASQLSSLEWAMSMPGTAEQKGKLVYQGASCAYCHTYERIVKSKHTAAEFVDVISRMQTYFTDGTAISGDRGRAQKNPPHLQASGSKNPNWGGVPKIELAQYLSTVNLSGGRATWPYELKTLPRPKGAATRVIMTQWDMPRKDTVPHDIAVDAKGTPWYGDQSRMIIGQLDPKTGTFTEHPLPPLPAGRVGGVSDMQADRDGNLWFPATTPDGDCHFGTPVRFEPKTQKLTWVEVPNRDAIFGTVNPCGLQFTGIGPDGKIWMNNTQAMVRIDPKTAKIDGTYFFAKGPNVPPGGHVGYQVVLSSKGNPFIADIGGSFIVGVDAGSGAVKYWPTPTPGVLPRRGQMDAQDRYWFTEYGADKIAMFDTRTEKFQEWPVAKYTAPYTSSAPDRNGRVYFSSNMSERLLRLDPKTGEVIEYQVPTSFDSKKILHDPATGRVALWMGNTRNARLLRVEPLD